MNNLTKNLVNQRVKVKGFTAAKAGLKNFAIFLICLVMIKPSFAQPPVETLMLFDFEKGFDVVLENMGVREHCFFIAFDPKTGEWVAG